MTFCPFFSYTKLPDDPAVRWREEIVSEAVLQVGRLLRVLVLSRGLGMGRRTKAFVGFSIQFSDITFS